MQHISGFGETTGACKMITVKPPVIYMAMSNVY